MEKRYQIFISSTFADLEEERGKVMQTILNFNCFPAGMELFPAMDEEQFEYIKKIIDDSDYYLLIIGGRYGSVDEKGVSWTEKEFDYAVSKGIPVIAFDHKDFTKLPVERTDQDNKKRKKLVAFKKKVSTGRLIKNWTDAKDLDAAVAKSLYKVLEQQPMTGWVRADVVTNTKLKERIENLQNEISELKDLVDKKEIELKDMEQSYKWAFHEKDEVFKLETKKNEDQYNALRKNYKAAEKKIEILQKEIDRLENQEEQNRNDQFILEKSYQKAQDKIKDIEGELERLIEKLKDSKGPIDKITIPDTDISFNMIHVEGGTFMMGANEGDEDANDNEKPAHLVTLSDYLIGETQVTQALWQAVMGKNPSCFKGDLNLPVDMVSWDDCQRFIKKLNKLTGKTFRLPTEAQWEFAARGGNLGKDNGYKYAGSDDIEEVAWYRENSKDKTHPVSKKAANELGLYDMSGNVREWCQDWQGEYSKDAQSNPTGPSSGSFRVCRGGSWYGDTSFCRVSNRHSNPPKNTASRLGLRLAM